MRYSPFSKPLDVLEASDLEVLRELSEGWYADYKRDSINPSQYGKHLSSFANQYGGWLFIGIAEDSQSLTAGEFPGIPSTEVADTIAKIRDGVEKHVSPDFHFDFREIRGPETTIGLLAERSILIIAVPESFNAPHVHSSGKIYRRVAENADPKEETDRRILDQLWQKSQNSNAQFEKFILAPVRSPGDPGRSRACYLYFLTNPYFEDVTEELTFQDFTSVLSTPISGVTASIPLTNYSATQDGYVAYQMNAGQKPWHNLYSVRFWRDGNVRFSIPIAMADPHGLYKAAKDPAFSLLLARLAEHDHFALKDILDLGQLLMVIVCAGAYYAELRDAAGMTRDCHVKSVIDDVFMDVPFAPMDSLAAQIGEFGVPHIWNSPIICPRSTAPKRCFRITDDLNLSIPERGQKFTALVALSILQGLGIAHDFFVRWDDQSHKTAILAEFLQIYSRLGEAGTRVNEGLL